MTVRAASYGKGRAVLLKALANLEPFTTGGALYADTYAHGDGRLNDKERARLHADANNIVYCVHSYATPIAWVTKDGTVYRVQQRFSTTTSKHQGLLWMLNGNG